MMFGYKHTFRVSWELGQGVRGLGVREASGRGTMDMMFPCLLGASTPLGFLGGWDKREGVGGLGVREASGHGTMNIGWNIMFIGSKHTVRLQWLSCSPLAGPAAKKNGVNRLQLLSCSPHAGPRQKTGVVSLQLLPAACLLGLPPKNLG